MTRPVLWHIEISHYNEKVRWALDFKGIPHERRAPLPGVLHPIHAFRLTRQPALPVLEIDGRAIADSTAIIAALEAGQPEPPLYPADPAERRRALEIEDFFDEEVAPALRKLAFWELSRDRDHAAAALGVIGAPGQETRVGRMLAPAFTTLAARRYGGSSAAMDPARERVRAGMKRIEAELGPSGFLVGDRFSVADLTAASILMLMAEPPEFGYTFPELTPSLKDFRDGLPPGAIDWIREMWRDHRPASAEATAAPGYTS